MWDILNFCLILLLLIIIIIIIIIVVYFYYKIKNYVDESIHHIGTLTPMFNSYEYKDIDYNLDFELPDEKFNIGIAKFLCNINMSSYNIFSNFNPKLNKSIKHVHTIGDNCYIYKLRHKLKDIRIVCYRGTRTGDDVITDLDSVQTEMSNFPNEILVHRGFYRLWSQYKDNLMEYINQKCDSNSIIFVTGHSLGCASAIFTSLLLSIYTKNLYLYMFAPPRVGNHFFIHKLNESVPYNYSIINSTDLIPNLPFVTFPTLGNTWYYENFSNRYTLDIQMGSISVNHRLDTYKCGIEENYEKCKEPIWNKAATFV